MEPNVNSENQIAPTSAQESPILTTATSVYNSVEALKESVTAKDEYIVSLKAALAAKDEAVKALTNTLNFAKEGSKLVSEGATPAEPTSSNEENKNKAEQQPDFNKLAMEALKNQQVEMQKENNIKLALDEVAKAYNTSSEDILKNKSATLGLGVEQLKELAGRSPTAFKQLMGLRKAEEKIPLSFNSERAPVVNKAELTANEGLIQGSVKDPKNILKAIRDTAQNYDIHTLPKARPWKV